MASVGLRSRRSSITVSPPTQSATSNVADCAKIERQQREGKAAEEQESGTVAGWGHAVIACHPPRVIGAARDVAEGFQVDHDRASKQPEHRGPRDARP